jgi:succinate dehydrogenase / fumarate reductase cytochrome b subunit
MNRKQFRNFNLFTIQYPLTAVVSLLHRLSGIFVFIFIPFLLWLFDIASGSPEGFDQIQSLLMHTFPKIMIWLIVIALWYHLIAGIRHLLMDVGFGESLRSARWSGGITIVLTIIWAILTGIWLW